MARTFRDVDLCELVKACAEAGVTYIKYGNLELNFGYAFPKWPKVVEPLENLANMDENEVGLGDEAELRERQSAELLLEDPEAYERLQLGEEI